MSDKQAVAIMAAILANGVRSSGESVDPEGCVKAAVELLYEVERELLGRR